MPLTYQSTRCAEVGLGDGQVYKASDNLSEPRQVTYLSGIGTKLDGSIQRSRDGLTVANLKKHVRVQKWKDRAYLEG